MKSLKLVFSLFCCVAIMATSCKSGNFGNAKLSTAADSASYMYGVYIGSSFTYQSELKDLKINILAKGISDGFSQKDGIPTEEEITTFLNEYFMNVQNALNQKNLEEGRAFLEKNKSEDGVVVLDNGIQYKVLTAAEGQKPTLDDQVKVNYHGTLIDGTVFDSSVDRGEPVTFALQNIIVGWQEVLPLMSVGAKWKVWIPTELAYGENVPSGGPLGPNMPLIFEIELLEINPAE